MTRCLSCGEVSDYSSHQSEWELMSTTRRAWYFAQTLGSMLFMSICFSFGGAMVLEWIVKTLELQRLVFYSNGDTWLLAVMAMLLFSLLAIGLNELSKSIKESKLRTADGEYVKSIIQMSQEGGTQPKVKRSAF